MQLGAYIRAQQNLTTFRIWSKICWPDEHFLMLIIVLFWTKILKLQEFSQLRTVKLIKQLEFHSRILKVFFMLKPCRFLNQNTNQCQDIRYGIGALDIAQCKSSRTLFLMLRDWMVSLSNLLTQTSSVMLVWWAKRIWRYGQDHVTMQHSH